MYLRLHPFPYVLWRFYCSFPPFQQGVDRLPGLEKFLFSLNYLKRSFCNISLQKSVKAGLYDEISLSRPWNVYFERKVSIYFRKRNVCREILFSLFTQSSFIHTIMITFHLYRELTILIFLIMDIKVLNHVWKYWKSAHNHVVSDWGKIRWRRWTS